MHEGFAQVCDSLKALKDQKLDVNEADEVTQVVY